MCAERVSAELAQAGRLKAAAVKSGDMCIKRECHSADAEVSCDCLQRLRKLLSISGLINTGCQSLQTQAALPFAEEKEL